MTEKAQVTPGPLIAQETTAVSNNTDQEDPKTFLPTTVKNK